MHNRNAVYETTASDPAVVIKDIKNKMRLPASQGRGLCNLEEGNVWLYFDDENKFTSRRLNALHSLSVITTA